MKQSALLVILVATLLKIQSTEAHFKPMHLESPLSSPLGFEQTSALSTFGQSSDLKTKLAIHKTITFLTILTSNPKLLCIVPPFLVIDFLTQLSCNPTILNAIPHHLLSGFMTSVTAVPTLANAIPPTLFVSISNSLSIGSPDSTGPAGSSGPELLPTPQPITSVSAEVAAVITPAAPSSGPASSLPGISVTKDVTASISPVAPSSGPAPGLPGVSITKDVTASITPSAPSPGPASSLPGVSITKDVSASIIPAAPSPGPASSLPGVSITQDVAASITPVAPSSGPASSLPGVSITKDVTASINPLPPADLPTSDGIPHAYPPAAPSAPAVPAVPAVGTSVPCIDVPTGGSPTLPALPLPSPTLPSLGLLSSLFNKGTAGSLIESKIEAIIKLFASGHLKLPQLPQLPPLPQLPLHIPEVGNTVSKKPIIHVNPEPSKVFILLPAPVLGKPEIPSAQATKLYYKPDSFNRILDFVHQRLFAPPQKLTLPKLNLPKLSLPKHNLPKLTPSYPAVSVQANPIKCPPIFSKVPC